MGKIVLFIVIYFVIFVGAFIVLAKPFGTVPAGNRGVLLRFGVVTGTILEEGLYYKIPFVHQVVLMSIENQKYTASATSSSWDLQVVSTEVTLNYQLNASQVGEIYATMRGEYENRIIQPYIQEAVRSTTANYNAEELLTQRLKVRNDLQDLLTERLALHGIRVIHLSITAFQFSLAFQQAFEAKMEAFYQALEAENAPQPQP